jgi:hypothetical protein
MTTGDGRLPVPVRGVRHSLSGATALVALPRKRGAAPERV